MVNKMNDIQKKKTELYNQIQDLKNEELRLEGRYGECSECGNNKNIRSRKAIIKAAQTIHQPFTVNDMASACGYGARRVGSLLLSIEGVRKEHRGNKAPRCVWWFEPK